MMLPAGLAIRFKGNNADRYASEFADSIRGQCARIGSKIIITKTTQIRVKLYPNGAEHSPREIDVFPSTRVASQLSHGVNLAAHRSHHE